MRSIVVVDVYRGHITLIGSPRPGMMAMVTMVAMVVMVINVDRVVLVIPPVHLVLPGPGNWNTG